MEACAACGRADLMQPDVVNLQCLACGALTSIDTGKVVVPHPPAENLSNAGLPVVELGHVVTADADDTDRRYKETPAEEAAEAPVEAPAPVGPIPAPVAPEPVPEPVVEPVVDIDFTNLTPDQIARIQAIESEG